MRIAGKEINDECVHCGEILECKLFKQGHGIRQETIAHIETTGQEVLGILRFEKITTDAGLKPDGKRKLYWKTPKALYLPIFETYQLIDHFSETSKVVVNNKFEFIAYAGNGCLIGLDPISKRPGEQED